MRKVLTGVAALALVGGLAVTMVPKATAASATLTASAKQVDGQIAVTVSGCGTTDDAASVDVGLFDSTGKSVDLREWLPNEVPLTGTYTLSATPKALALGNYIVDVTCVYYDGSQQLVLDLPVTFKPWVGVNPEQFTSTTPVTLTGNLFTPNQTYSLVATYTVDGTKTVVGSVTAGADGMWTLSALLPYNGAGAYTLEVLDANGAVVSSFDYTYGDQNANNPTNPTNPTAPSTPTAPAPGKSGKPGVSNTGGHN